MSIKGYSLSKENTRNLFGVLNKGPLYIPASIFQVKDFIGQERGLEKVLQDQGIEKEYCTISNLEGVKDFLRHKSLISFDEALIKPKVLTHDFDVDRVSQANKMRNQLRHIGGETNPITLDMIQGGTEDDDLKAICDSNIKTIDLIRGNKSLGKMKELMRQRYDHTSSGIVEDFTNERYDFTPREKIELKKQLERM